MSLINFSEFESRRRLLAETAQHTRYSVEINYRTTTDEVLDANAKITLGYVSAALKNVGLHCKQVFDSSPIRLLVSTRNWDDGEWIGVVSWNSKLASYVISKGFYNKDRKTVSVQNSHKCSGTSAADITKELRNLMHGLKDKPDRHKEKMKPVPLKRGPK
jgi:hypothetical protein